MGYQDREGAFSAECGAFERKDGGGDTGAEGITEVKEGMDKLKSILADFKSSNDENIDRRAKGIVDPLVENTLEKMNGAIDEAVEGVQQKLTDYADAQKERLDDLEVQLKRSRKGGGKDDDEDIEAKAADFFRVALNDPTLEKGDNRVDVDALSAYEKHYGEYLRLTRDRSMTPDALKDMQVGGDPRGGYWVPPAMSSRIVGKLFDTSAIRSIAGSETISSDRLVIAVDRDELSFGWVGETTARPVTDTPQIGEKEIPVHEMYAMPQSTQNMLDDAQVNVQSWLEKKANDKFGRAEETAFVTGNGTNKPRGFMDYSSDAVVGSAYDDTDTDGILSYRFTGNAAGFDDVDAFVECVYDLKPGYRNDARWVLARQTLSAVRKLKDANGLYLWEPNIQVGQPGTILGFGIAEAEDMPAMATDAYTVAFGNFGIGYLIVDRQGMRLLVDPFSNKPYVQFYMTRRVGGDVVDFETIKLIKQATS